MGKGRGQESVKDLVKDELEDATIQINFTQILFSSRPKYFTLKGDNLSFCFAKPGPCVSVISS